MIANCKAKFDAMRNEGNIEVTWQRILQSSTSFANEHEIDVEIVERCRKKRMMAGESTVDESRVGQERIRVDMFIPVLEQICMQLNDRFDDEQQQLLNEMAIFASSNLKKGSAIKQDDIAQLTQIYNLNADELVLEFSDFCEAYFTLNIPDQSKDTRHDPGTSVDCTFADEDVEVERNVELDDDNDISDGACVYDAQWKLHNYVNPLKVCYQLTSYPHLLRLYWILVTLPVTSCSAERAVSRLRIIKNRLRSTMTDKWMKALMVIAAEKDLLSSNSNDVIIDKFASISNELKKNLIHL